MPARPLFSTVPDTDGKFIFFSHEGDFWWAGAEVIERLNNEIFRD